MELNFDINKMSEKEGISTEVIRKILDLEEKGDYSQITIGFIKEELDKLRQRYVASNKEERSFIFADWEKTALSLLERVSNPPEIREIYSGCPAVSKATEIVKNRWRSVCRKINSIKGQSLDEARKNLGESPIETPEYKMAEKNLFLVIEKEILESRCLVSLRKIRDVVELYPKNKKLLKMVIEKISSFYPKK